MCLLFRHPLLKMELIDYFIFDFLSQYGKTSICNFSSVSLITVTGKTSKWSSKKEVFVVFTALIHDVCFDLCLALAYLQAWPSRVKEGNPLHSYKICFHFSFVGFIIFWYYLKSTQTTFNMINISHFLTFHDGPSFDSQSYLVGLHYFFSYLIFVPFFLLYS